ncbi:MAG: hypothetical protein M0018_10840 [Nitrospiraceae bacterium]|nr:hypothetical protein [Nitrospiraceae bacterium]
MCKGRLVPILLALLFVFSAIPAFGAYRIYLKNGSVISGLPNIEKKDGQVKFLYHGGMIGVPDSEVLKIEQYTPGAGEKLVPEHAVPSAPAPKTVKPHAGGKGQSARESQIQNQIAIDDGALQRLQVKLDKYKDLQDEYYQVRLRIENLFEKGRNAAMAAGKSPLVANQVYMQYLSPDEQSMVQSNFIRKGQLEDIFNRKKDEIAADRRKKADLLREKAHLEDQLKGLQSGTAF